MSVGFEKHSIESNPNKEAFDCVGFTSCLGVEPKNIKSENLAKGDH